MPEERMKDVPIQTKETAVDPMKDIDFSFLENQPETESEEVSGEITDKADVVSNEPDSEEEFMEVDHLKEKKNIPRSQWKDNIQMGLQYPHTKEQLETTRRENAELLQQLNIAKEKAATDEIELQRKVLIQRFEDDGHDPQDILKLIETSPAMVAAQKYVKEMEAKTNSFNAAQRILKEKDSVRGDPLFSTLEPRIDRILKDAPQLNVDSAYTLAYGEYMRSGKYEELQKEAKDNATKQAANNLKRGTKNLTGDTIDKKQTKKEPSSFGRMLDKSLGRYLKETGK